MTESVEPVVFSGSLDQPDDTIGSFFGHAWPYLTLSSVEGVGIFSFSGWGAWRPAGSAQYGFFGAATRVDGRAAPTWTFEAEYVPVEAIADPSTVYGWRTLAVGDKNLQPFEVMTYVVVLGLPGDAPMDLDFSEPPVLVSHGALTPYRFGELLEWQLGDPDVADPTLGVMIRVFAGDDLNQLMTLFAPPGTTAALIPLPPSDVDPGALLGVVGHGQVRTCEFDAARRVCMRQAMGIFFDVLP